MKILGEPQVRPDMVFSLTRLIGTCGQQLSDDEIYAWMAPSIAAGGTNATAASARKLLKDVADVARSLGFIADDSWKLGRDLPTDFLQFGDVVHDVLLEQGEWDIIDTYASLAVEIELSKVDWLLEKSQSDIAELLGDRIKIKAGPSGGASAVMNPTRWPAWRSWAMAAGLGVSAPGTVGGFVPIPSRPVARVAKSIRELERGREIEAPKFLAKIAKELPYLDDGARAAIAWQRAGNAPRGESVSFVLSTCLRDLHYHKVIDLRFEGGDRAGARRLYPDGSEPEAFATVRLGEAAR